MVFSIRTKSSIKLELFKVQVLLVITGHVSVIQITGKPQTLARNISGTKGRILIQFFLLV